MSRRKRARGEVRTAGIEIDGQRAVAVLCVDGVATATWRSSGAPTDTLKDLLEKVGQAAVRVVAPTPDSFTAPTAVTAAALNRAVFTTTAHTRTGTHPDLTTLAVTVDPAELDPVVVTPALILTGPRTTIDPLYQAWDSPHGQITHPAANTDPLEGLSLALRATAAEVTLVRSGRTVATRILPAGGLAALDQALGQGATVGTTRLGAAMGHPPTMHPTDPEATDLLERYLRLIAGQVKATCEEWNLAGPAVPTTVYVHGPGARARTLERHLADAGLTRRKAHPVELALTAFDPSDRPELVTAVLAAQGVTSTTHRVYPNPAQVAAAVKEHGATRRRARRRTTAAAVTLTAVAWAGPAAVGAADLLRATWERDAATTAASERLGTDLTGLLTAAPAGAALGSVWALADTTGATVTDLTVAGADVAVTLATEDPTAILAAADQLVGQVDATYTAGNLTLRWREGARR